MQNSVTSLAAMLILNPTSRGFLFPMVSCERANRVPGKSCFGQDKARGSKMPLKKVFLKPPNSI